jgi:hypothetical protein
MRIVALLVLLALAAGCLEPPAPDDGPSDEAPRTSVPGPDEDGEEFDEVLLFETSLQLLGAEEEATFEVEVPAALASVFARHTPEVNTVAAGFEVELEGCGVEGFPAPGPYGGNVPRDFDLCEEPAAGQHVLTVRSGGGYVDGTLELWGRRPATNETVDP